jgi:hypothetical protein
VRPAHWLPRIEQAIVAEGAKHFVLLLLEPSLDVEGVYALAPSLRAIRRVWGDTPEEISMDDEPVRFWRYNGTTNDFVELKEHAFSPLTDAISM